MRLLDTKFGGSFLQFLHPLHCTQLSQSSLDATAVLAFLDDADDDGDDFLFVVDGDDDGDDDDVDDDDDDTGTFKLVLYLLQLLFLD